MDDESLFARVRFKPHTPGHP